MEIATIGFTQSTAEHFFERLKAAGIRRVLDVRLHNVSQLAGFAKAQDLAYFARAICDASYEHDDRLAPTREMLATYRSGGQPWTWYEAQFVRLMKLRDIPAILDRRPFDDCKTVLLCSEPRPEQCHRRLVAELLQDAWAVRVEHL
ncbi:MAG: DUF488 family protein [Dehalococcoidia bacterium]